MLTERRQERTMNKNGGTSTEISSEIPKTIFEKNTFPGLQKQEDIKQQRLEDLSKNCSKLK